tara:strand:- start:6011 stop:6892 length:882 start_codon:yes stop_codon:yes gene_type:complete
MADRIVKPDTGNDLVLQNDDASAKIEINEDGSIPVTGTIAGNINVSGGTFTTSSAQKQAIVQAGPGSGTLDVSSGTFTTSSAQKQTIVDGATIEAQDLASGSGTSLPNNIQDAITRLGTVVSGTLSHGTSLQGYVDASNTGVAFPNGHVIQVKSFSMETEGQHTGNSTFAQTGVEVDITPRTTSSKFFVIVSTSGYANGGNAQVVYYTIFRDSTDLGSSNSAGFADLYQGSNSPANANLGTSVCFSTYDAPSGLSLSTSIKYELYVRTSVAANSVYWSMNGSESTITVMEVAQ